jgi:VWFA-related protein
VRELGTSVGAGLAAMSLAAAVLSVTSAQTLSPDEFRLSNHPYFPRPAIRVQSELVQLEVVVRDTRGRPVCGLTKDDFKVYDSGKSRDLSAFSEDVAAGTASSSPRPAGQTTPASQAALPPPTPAQTPPSQHPQEGRSVVLLFDDLNTTTGDLGHAKNAAQRFIREAVASGDRMALFTTSRTQTLDFTGDAAAILAAVAKVETHLRLSASGLASCPRITAYEAYRIVTGDPVMFATKVDEACHCTESSAQSCPPSSPEVSGSSAFSAADPLADTVRAQADATWEQALLSSRQTLAAIQASLARLLRAPGRKLLLLASSGFLSGMLEEEKDAIIDEALRTGVVISSLDAKGLYAETPGRPIEEATETSGLTPNNLLVTQVESLGDRLDSADSAMAKFAESTGGLMFRDNNDLDLGFHQIGLMPACTYLMGFPPAKDDKYHKIKVEYLKRRREFIQVRPGYFGTASSPAAKPGAADRVDAAVNGSDEKTELKATSTETPGNAALGGRQVTIRTHVDIQGVPFETRKDRRVQKLSFVAVLFAADGRMVTGKEAVMDLALKKESFERLSKSGITGSMSLQAPAGAYRLRIVVQEAVSGKMSATSKEVHIS